MARQESPGRCASRHKISVFEGIDLMASCVPQGLSLLKVVDNLVNGSKK